MTGKGWKEEVGELIEHERNVSQGERGTDCRKVRVLNEGVRWIGCDKWRWEVLQKIWD